MTTFRIGDIVMINKEKVEVTPLNFVREGMIASVIDRTVPNYYRVKFTNGQVEWIDGKYLKKVQ